jgi:hypothetical protein
MCGYLLCGGHPPEHVMPRRWPYWRFVSIANRLSTIAFIALTLFWSAAAARDQNCSRGSTCCSGASPSGGGRTSSSFTAVRACIEPVPVARGLVPRLACRGGAHGPALQNARPRDQLNRAAPSDLYQPAGLRVDGQASTSREADQGDACLPGELNRQRGRGRDRRHQGDVGARRLVHHLVRSA